jgi:hypothetical protein
MAFSILGSGLSGAQLDMMKRGGERDVSRFIMPISEYNRIHQVAHGVLKDIGRVEKACKFFACFGAMVLNKHYKIPARVVAGGFALCIDSKPEVAFFGHAENGRISSSPDGFHMWVQTATHVIDFMAPFFPEAFADAGLTTAIPRKMLQRPLTTEAKSLDALNTPGSYYTLPDPDMTEAMIGEFLSRAQNADLLLIADGWYGGQRRRQKPVQMIRDDLGEIIELRLPSIAATEAW